MPKLHTRFKHLKIVVAFSLFWVGYSLKAQDTTQLDVAVILPYKFNTTLSKDAIRKNLPLLDFYDGLRLGSLHLSEKGMAVTFHHYDSERNVGVVNKIIKLPEVQKSKLWIGPIYSPEAGLMAKEAQQAGVLMVNPLSSRVTWDTANKNAFLFQNTLSGAAKYIAQNSIQTLPCQKVLVLYDADSKDSVFATEYKKALEALGGKVIALKRVGKKDKVIMGSLLRINKADSTGHILLASEREHNHVQLLAALKLEGLKIPIITTDAWLETQEHTVEDLEAAKIRFYYPSFRNQETQVYRRFEADFISLYSRMPSDYAVEGYEILMRYARLSAKFGKQAPNLLKLRGKSSGTLMPDFDYSKGSENQNIPYFEFRNRVLVPVSNNLNNPTIQTENEY